MRRRTSLANGMGAFAFAFVVLVACPRSNDAMPILYQLIRGQADDGQWYFLLTPMTSREIPADAVIQNAKRFATRRDLAGALEQLPPRTTIHVAAPDWFGPPRDRLAALRDDDMVWLQTRVSNVALVPLE